MTWPKDHTDLAAVVKWVSDTVEAQESKKARYIMIPITMMRTLLYRCKAGDGWRCTEPEGHRGPHVDEDGKLYG